MYNNLGFDAGGRRSRPPSMNKLNASLKRGSFNIITSSLERTRSLVSSRLAFFQGKKNYLSTSSIVLASTSGTEGKVILPNKAYPVKIYKDIYLNKQKILLENKGKAGIYRFINLENGKSYIGSSDNLGRRLRSYLNRNHLLRHNMVIYKSLLKYGYSKFSWEILEYCIAEECTVREQYYLDLLKPEYNILKIANSIRGFKHPKDSKLFKHLVRLNANLELKVKRLERLKRMHSTLEHKERFKRINENPELIAQRLERLKRINADPEFQAKRLEQLNRFNSSKKHLEHLKNLTAKQSHQVSVLDTLTNERTVYPSINEVARAIGITAGAISTAFKKKGDKGETNPTITVKKKRYQITKLPSF